MRWKGQRQQAQEGRAPQSMSRMGQHQCAPSIAWLVQFTVNDLEIGQHAAQFR